MVQADRNKSSCCLLLCRGKRNQYMIQFTSCTPGSTVQAGPCDTPRGWYWYKVPEEHRFYSCSIHHPPLSLPPFPAEGHFLSASHWCQEKPAVSHVYTAGSHHQGNRYWSTLCQCFKWCNKRVLESEVNSVSVDVISCHVAYVVARWTLVSWVWSHKVGRWSGVSMCVCQPGGTPVAMELSFFCFTP